MLYAWALYFYISFIREMGMVYYEKKELKHQKLNIRNSIKNYEEDRMI